NGEEGGGNARTVGMSGAPARAVVASVGGEACDDRGEASRPGGNRHAPRGTVPRRGETPRPPGGTSKQTLKRRRWQPDDRDRGRSRGRDPAAPRRSCVYTGVPGPASIEDLPPYSPRSTCTSTSPSRSRVIFTCQGLQQTSQSCTSTP